ncbi:hypothetical protein V2J09_010884 [Rumex salicifolius]
MAALKRKPLIARPNPNSSDAHHVSPLMDPNHSRSHSAGNLFDKMSRLSIDAKENQEDSKANTQNKENTEPNIAKTEKLFPDRRTYLKDRALKPTSLQLCMLKTEPDSGFGSTVWDPLEPQVSRSGNVWDYSDSETAPASSWSTLPNRALLYRHLPADIGRCACIIVKERAAEGLGFGYLFSLYTYEGQGRQNRKLAVAYRKGRHGGRSEFVVAQNLKGLLCNSDDSFIGSIKANLLGSRYYIWDQESSSKSNGFKQPDHLQGIVAFTPTISTWTGSYRSMKVWIPKHQQQQQHSSQMKKSTNQMIQKDWEGKIEKVHQLLSKVPYYNNVCFQEKLDNTFHSCLQVSKQYELDFRERSRAGFRIQTSVKNFQLTMEGDGRQTILQLGRVGKSKYVMDYRYPLTGYQAFCICLASIDPKWCCTV